MNARIRLFAAALGILACLPGASPQEDDPVYIDEEKKDFLDKIERCRAASDWKALFDLQAQASHPKKAHKLVRLPGAEARYVGLIEYLNRKFADLPAEALQYYRGQFDGAAKREFDQAKAAGDRDALEHVVETWFYSSRTDEALDLLANLYVEEGRHSMAIHCWSRLLYHYPDSEIPIPVTAARLARAATQSGHEGVLEAVRRHVQENSITGDVIVGDGPVSLDSFLKDLVVDRPPSTGVPVREPTVAVATSDLGRLTGVRPEIKRWSADLASGPDPMPRTPRGFAISNTDFPFIPAYGKVDGHEMVVYTNGTRVVVIDPRRATSGKPEEGVYFSYPPAGESPARLQQGAERGYSINWTRPYIGVTIEGDYAFATMYSGKRARDPIPAGGGVPDTLFGMTRLVCLNLRTQQVMWDTDFGEPGNALRKMELWEHNFAFSGPPLVRGDRVYAGIGTSPLSEEQSHVLCFDRRTGILLWQRFLASVTNTRPFWDRGGGTNVISRQTVLEEDRGALIAHGNLGVIAALDAVTGHVKWLSKYSRSGIGPDNWGRAQVFSRPASPLVLHRGKIYALPQDATDMLIVDAATGAVRREPIKVGTVSSTGPQNWRDFHRLVGRMGDYLVLGASSVDSCIFNTTDGTFYGLPSTITSGTGRGVIDGETVYLPCMDSGKGSLNILHGLRNWIAFERTQMLWPIGESGNIVRGGNYLIFCSNTKISIYTDSEVVRAEYKRRLEQSPPNPAAWLDYGMLMRENERWAEAARGYQNFIEAVQGDPEWINASREVRTRLHGIFLKLGGDATARKLPADAAAHFRRARDFAWDAATLMESTRLLAGACESAAEIQSTAGDRRSWARRAVEEYQELLRRSPAGFVKPGESMLWIPIRRFASSRISALVKKHGADAYEGVSRLASEELKKAGRNPAALRALADLYPDSIASIEALDRIAELEAGQKKWTRVASVLRDMRFRLGERWTPLQQKRLVEALEKGGDAERVELELGRMERLFEGAARMGAEENAPSVADYLVKARAAAASMTRRPAEPAVGSTATLSTFDIPDESAGLYEQVVGWTLLVPDGLEPLKGSPDVEFFARGSSLELWNVRTKKKVWAAAHPGGWTGIAFTDGPADTRSVRVVDVVPDSPAERAGLRADDLILSVDGASVGGEDFDLATEARAPGVVLALVYKRGEETRRVDMTPVAWPASSRPGIVGAVFTGDGLVAVAWEDVIAAFDPADGRVVWTSRPCRDRFVIREVHAVADRILAHETFLVDRARSPYRRMDRLGAKAPLPAEDQHSRVLALDENDGSAIWALGLRFEPATVSHHSVQFLGRALDSHAALIVSGYQSNVRMIEMIPVAGEDGREGGRIPLSGYGGQPAAAWMVEPKTGTMWVIDSTVRGQAKLRSYARPDYTRGPEIALESHVDPNAAGFAMSATEDRIAVASISRGPMVPRVAVFAAKDGSVIASLRPGEGPIRDRVMPVFAPPQQERRLMSGLLTMEPDGLIILYNETKPGDGKARSAWLTALAVENGGFKKAWEAVTPSIVQRSLAEREILTVRSGPRGTFVTTHRGVSPGKSEESAILSFHNRKDEGAVRKLVDDLSAPIDSFGQRLDPTPSHHGRMFVYRKGVLEVWGD